LIAAIGILIDVNPTPFYLANEIPFGLGTALPFSPRSIPALAKAFTTAMMVMLLPAPTDLILSPTAPLAASS
jgi:hypothetical protein